MPAREFDPLWSLDQDPTKERVWTLRAGEVFRGVPVSEADLPSMAAQAPMLEGYKRTQWGDDYLSIFYVGNPAWVSEFNAARSTAK